MEKLWVEVEVSPLQLKVLWILDLLKWTFTLDVHFDVTIIFNLFPNFQISSQKLDAASVDATSVDFKGFGDNTRDSNVSANLSKGGPAWTANNLDLLNRELDNAFVSFTNFRLGNFLNLSNIINTINAYDPLAKC